MLSSCQCDKKELLMFVKIVENWTHNLLKNIKLSQPLGHYYKYTTNCLHCRNKHKLNSLTMASTVKNLEN
jgi:hypothetical protein